MSDGAEIRAVQCEQRALCNQAVQIWLQAAERAGNPYTDRVARSMVRDQVLRALRDEDGAIVLRAIVARMDQESPPMRIPEWARIQGSDERQLRHVEQTVSERAKSERIVEHQGTLYLGHVPDAVGDKCAKCGGTLADHRLARAPRMRHVSEIIAEAVTRA